LLLPLWSQLDLLLDHQSAAGAGGWLSASAAAATTEAMRDLPSQSPASTPFVTPEEQSEPQQQLRHGKSDVLLDTAATHVRASENLPA
jgi:hypothetical protein